MFSSPKWAKFFLSLYPPYIGAGIRIDFVRDDWKEIHASMKMHWYNRNAFGTHFGGSLYSMVDPQYLLMLLHLLGKDYIVWDKSADINFVKPGKGTLKAKFLITDKDLEDIKKNTADNQKYLPNFYVRVFDEDNDTVAEINKTVYVRKKKARHS
ncbi:DUF4442 domain-containing protein [Agarilytica rhodophyticola]|uniref:DUF4442 domain-containing protein n=1 Tax=Agarilytica rhodophyticola TaxID=1737490 RepID=UPI000B345DD9|nr:DUF4442 domain-containing protein [Agarilytica rhodophyticola]